MAAARNIWPPVGMRKGSPAGGRIRSGNRQRATVKCFSVSDLLAATDNGQQPSDRLTAKHPLQLCRNGTNLWQPLYKPITHGTASTITTLLLRSIQSVILLKIPAAYPAAYRLVHESEEPDR